MRRSLLFIFNFFIIAISNVHIGCLEDSFSGKKYKQVDFGQVRWSISYREEIPEESAIMAGIRESCIDFRGVLCTCLLFLFKAFQATAIECPPPAWLPSHEVGCPCKCNGILPPACVLPCASSFSLCLPSWKSSVCRKQVTVTVANLPQTSTFEGGMRYIFGHTPYQPLETYQDEQRKYQNYDTYKGGVVQFNLQRKTEVETYPGGIVEFDQYDHTNSWHPLQIIDEDGVVIQTSSGTSQRPATLVFEARQSQAGKTFILRMHCMDPVLPQV